MEHYVWAKSFSCSVIHPDFLTTKHPICPAFYGLPKIHKTIVDPPLRPIVSGNGSLIEPMSQYIDSFIKKLVPDLPAYLGDTTDILNAVDHLKVSTDCILATLDVQSLYTNIPHTGGLEALTHFLEKRPEGISPPNEFLLTLTEMALKMNFFQYGGSYYIQSQGTAMGAAFAPNYANLFMGYWEQKCIDNPATNTFHSKISLYRRYIDDIFMIWNGSEDEFTSRGPNMR